MPHLIEFEPHERIIRVTVQGELSDRGATDLYQAVQAFLSKNQVRGGILDLSPVTSLPMGLNAVRSLAKSPPLFSGPQVRVIVAASDLIFGMSRLFQISRSEIHGELYVVHTLEEAYQIHSLRDPQFQFIESDSGGRENP
jgi:hypothetical protein